MRFANIFLLDVIAWNAAINIGKPYAWSNHYGDFESNGRKLLLCNDLVENNDFEDGNLSPWFTNSGNIEIVDGAGMGGSKAIINSGRTNRRSGPRQYLETSCFPDLEDYYEIEAWFRLEIDGSNVVCDPLSTHSLACPSASFEIHHPDTTITYLNRVATAVVPYESDQFSFIHGILKIDDTMGSASKILLHFYKVDTNMEVIIDDVSIKPLNQYLCDSNLIRNGNLDSGDNSFWKPIGGTTKFEMVEIESNTALKTFGRERTQHGARLDIIVNCLQINHRYKVLGRFKLKNSETGDGILCDRSATSGDKLCANMKITSSPSDGGSNVVKVIANSVAADANVARGWDLLAGIYTVDEEHTENLETLYVSLTGPDPGNDVIWDDISITPLALDCENLLLNPSFDDGTASFWQPQSAQRINANIISPGAGGTGYSLLFWHTARAYGMKSLLDPHCFAVGEEFVLSGKFKLLNATDLSEELSCNPNVKNINDVTHCPSIRLKATNCDGNDEDLRFWNDVPFFEWDPSTFNLFQSQFYITPNLSTCENIEVHVASYLPVERALVLDDVQISIKRTDSPTKYPTIFPTPQKEITPTLKPSAASNHPSMQGIPCPQIQENPIELNSGSVMIFVAVEDVLCTISKVTFDDDGVTEMAVTPVARSYSKMSWEIIAGDFTSLIKDIVCYDSGCQFQLPTIESGSKYLLSSATHLVSEREELARFLESATMGTTLQELDALEGIASKNIFITPIQKITKWIKDQMDINLTPMTSHRAYWRERANPRLHSAIKMGLPDHPCNATSRWKKVAFVANEVLDELTDANKVFHVSGDGPYVLYLNSYPRTVVENVLIEEDGYSGYTFDPNYDYNLCQSRNMDVGVGGPLKIRLEDGNCYTTRNPIVNFDGFEDLPSFVLNLPGDPDIQSIDSVRTGGTEYMLMTDLIDSTCNAIPVVVNFNDEPVFGVLPDGTWLQYDPRLTLKSNTAASPLADGGKSSKEVSGGATFCSNVPRNFLNEEECVLETDACEVSSNNGAIQIPLNDAFISNLYELTGRYVYQINGLTVIDEDGNEIAHPCTAGLRSRWELKNINDCNPSSLAGKTKTVLTNLLYSSTDPNPFIRDIYFPETGFSCSSSDTNPEIELNVDGTCWRRVHQDHMSVYDLTYWTENHPGGKYHITKWADERSSTVLIYPSTHPTNTLANHPMTRWDNNYHKFPYVGRFGDDILLMDLPASLRTDEVLQYYNDDSDSGGNRSVVVCGSPNEVANDMTKGFVFDVDMGDNFQTDYFRSGENRAVVWTMIALNAVDQLRQRVAFALSQILVVVPAEVSRSDHRVEGFANYYDIFVRHAFGNYRDILREISFSVQMSENLSFLRSKSSSYLLERYNLKAQADENFAREIMQLFSIGIVELNDDGTNKLNDEGETILTYSNDDITSFSRAWTGFDQQPNRGNVEGSNIDPMTIVAEWRDRSPKSAWNTYIGDKYPLCADTPKGSFLLKGATYKIQGSSDVLNQRNYVRNFGSESTSTVFVLDEASELKSSLCNDINNDGNCEYLNTITLRNNLNCIGNECTVDTVQVIQVEESVYYEYQPPACVQFAFYNHAKKLSQRGGTDANICGNPQLSDASEACCELGSSDATRHSYYQGESMTFVSAQTRCSANSKYACDFDKVLGDKEENVGFFWTTGACLLRVKVQESGLVSIVHEPSSYSSKVLHVNDANENYFKVFWEDQYPRGSTGCDGLCRQLSDNTCLCNTQVISSRVFSRMPRSIAEALSELNIGALDPSSYDMGNYSSRYDINTKITVHYTTREHDVDTIYEFTDDKGRQHFLKNERSTVLVYGLSGDNTGHSFRNAPQFNSFIPSQTNSLNAKYETEATLDKYFYHDNLAPFLASRLIQRFVTSNPSPRYIKAVSNAFKSGTYELFGSGEYGDMAAAIAAVLLDPEARNVILDIDPTHGMLKEPLLKVMGLMRSMEFRTEEPTVMMVDMEENIGQMAHEFPSVFSFFLPEFKPSGHIGNSGLVSPELMLLDMPKLVGLLNGFNSMVKYGLSRCNSGFGVQYPKCQEYSKNPGILTYNRTSVTSEFSFETFEGPSLNGGFDNTWVGRNFNENNGESVLDPHPDPNDPNNHVLYLQSTSSGDFFSPIFSQLGGVGTTVVKFRYYSIHEKGGGCIGAVSGDIPPTAPLVEEWLFCDSVSRHGQNPMTSAGEWITCQFELPQLPDGHSSYRIVIGDIRGSGGDAYFDDVQLNQNNNGTTCSNVEIGQMDPPGEVGYSETIVDELALLLTSGRLSSESRKIVTDAFHQAGSAADGLEMAQQLMLSSPEFHSTNIVKATDIVREPFAFPSATSKPYKAVVYVMFTGGCDSYNMLVPHTCTKSKDLYSEYFDVRQNVALPKNVLLPINVEDQICEKFGIHPALPIVRDMYNDDDLLFFANTGVLTKPVNKDNYKLETKTQLFAHNTMQSEVQKLDPSKVASNTGIMGRMGDALTESGSNVGLFSVDGISEAVVSLRNKPIISSSKEGLAEIHMTESMKDAVQRMNNVTMLDSGFFGEAWSDELTRSIDITDVLGSKLDSSVTKTTFPDTKFGKKLAAVAKLIATRNDRGVDKDFFFVSMSGYDTHADVDEELKLRFEEVNSAFEAFQNELKHPEVDLWNKVVTMQVSDFGRTLNPNSGEGTDHAWGGNYMIFGGPVKGGQIKGTFPDTLTEDGENILGRGRIIPTTPWDACFRGIALWLGISNLNNICVNCGNFPSSMLFDRNELFEPSNEPTTTPTISPSTVQSSLPSTSVTNTPSIDPYLSPVPSLYIPPTWNIISYDDFENGWGSFKTGGKDATRWTKGRRRKAFGKSSLRIRDNMRRKSAVIYKDLVDVSDFTQVKVTYKYIVHNFKIGEDFLLEVYNGSSWSIHKSYVYGTDFLKLRRWQSPSEIIDTTTITSMKIRFRCDASSNRDQVFLDNITVEGWGRA